MARIILTRHGETEWNVNGFVQGSQDSPLTQAGLEQAKRLAERLESENIDLLVSSPLGRALATAQVIADKRGIPLITCPEFSEICFGEWEGKAWRELPKLDPEGYRQWEHHPHTFRFPRGETFEEVLARSKAKLQELWETNGGHTICVVSHGITLKVLVTHFMGFGLQDWLQTPWQSNTAVNIFDIVGGSPRAVLVGDASHNPEKTETDTARRSLQK